MALVAKARGVGVVIYKDLRGFIKQVDELGVLRRINGADPRFELGGITEVAAGSAECPALLFDRIKGFRPGFRVFTNATTTPQRAALALGIDPALAPLDALKAWMGKRQTLKPQKPLESPVPFGHEFDDAAFDTLDSWACAAALVSSKPSARTRATIR